MFLITPSLSMGQNWEPTSFVVFTMETWSNHLFYPWNHDLDRLQGHFVPSRLSRLSLFQFLSETDLNQIFWDKTDLSKRKQWNQTWNQIFLVYPVYHLKDLELSIEIRRSPGPGAFFSWTFWADLGVKKHLGDPVLMGLNQLSPNSWGLITMILRYSKHLSTPTACSPALALGGLPVPDPQRRSAACPTSSWPEAAGTCHYITICIYIYSSYIQSWSRKWKMSNV